MLKREREKEKEKKKKKRIKEKRKEKERVSETKIEVERVLSPAFVGRYQRLEHPQRTRKGLNQVEVTDSYLKRQK